MADDTQTPPAADSTEQQKPIQRLLEAFGRLPMRQRLSLLVGIPLLIAIAVAALLWSRAPEYRVLFSGLSDQDGGSIVATLQQQNIPYRVSDNGTAILVQADQVPEVRLRLASQGLPRAGNVGFELMDNSRLGLTQFQEQVNYQRALEGELARSIQSLGTVKSARVHLAIPKPSIFMREQNRPTASVLVTMLPGRVLERNQIAGIVHLVSSSVPDLAPGNVSIVDQTGALLSANEVSPTGLDATQLEYLHAMEQQYIRRISDLISPIVGAQNLRAQVAIDMDFSRQEETNESYRPNGGSPDQAAIRSRQSSESLEPANPNDGGVPGSLSNTPPGAATAPTTGGAPTNPPANATQQPPLQNMKKADTTNYELDKTVRYTREPVGRIKRVSAAVVVNQHSSMVKGKVVSTPLSEDEVAQIKSLVSEAVGFDASRRDSLSVISVPFNDSDQAVEPPFYRQPEFLAMARDIGVALILALAVLYLIVGVIRPAVRQMLAPPTAPEREYAAMADGLSFAPGETGEHGLEGPSEAALERVRVFARANPQLVANVIRQWVNDQAAGPPLPPTAGAAAAPTPT